MKPTVESVLASLGVPVPPTDAQIQAAFDKAELNPNDPSIPDTKAGRLERKLREAFAQNRKVSADVPA